MAVISGGRYARGVQKQLGIKGETVIPDLDSALQAGFDIIDAETQPDTAFLYGWRRYSIQLSAAADAANFVVAQLSNPAGSGVLAVIEYCRIRTSVTAAQTVIVTMGAGNLVAGRGVPRDFRQGPRATSRSALFAGAVAAAAVGGSNMGDWLPDFQITATDWVFTPVRDENDHWVVVPGDDWIVGTPAINTGMRGVLQWRERALDPSELTA